MFEVKDILIGLLVFLAALLTVILFLIIRKRNELKKLQENANKAGMPIPELTKEGVEKKDTSQTKSPPEDVKVADHGEVGPSDVESIKAQIIDKPKKEPANLPTTTPPGQVTAKAEPVMTKPAIKDKPVEKPAVKPVEKTVEKKEEKPKEKVKTPKPVERISEKVVPEEVHDFDVTEGVDLEDSEGLMPSFLKGKQETVGEKAKTDETGFKPEIVDIYESEEQLEKVDLDEEKSEKAVPEPKDSVEAEIMRATSGDTGKKMVGKVPEKAPVTKEPPKPAPVPTPAPVKNVPTGPSVKANTRELTDNPDSYMGKTVIVEGDLKLSSRGENELWYLIFDDTGNSVVSSKKEIPHEKARIYSEVKKTRLGQIYLDVMKFEKM